MDENAATACQEISRFIDETSQFWNPQGPPVAELFHYTTVEGLIGIITSSSLWASDMLSLNDASEATYPFKIITEALDIQRSGVPEEHRRRFKTQLTEYLFRVYTPFVACFCEDGDLLSQWKGYGDGGEGFALGVGFSWLLSLANSGFRLQQVIYDADQQVDLVLMLLASVSSLLTERSFSDQEQTEIWLHAAASLAPWVVMFKDPVFREEREWRLVNVSPIPPPYSFRRSGHRIVPYVKIPVSDCQAITRVVRGPYFSGTDPRGAYIMTVSRGFILGATFHDSKVPLRR